MINYELAFLIAVFSFVYCIVLTEPEMLLNGLYKWMDGLFATDLRAEFGKGKHWLFKVLIACEKCNSGQIALWLFLYKNWYYYIIDPFQTLLNHVFFISFTIFLTTIVKITHTKLNENGS